MNTLLLVMMHKWDIWIALLSKKLLESTVSFGLGQIIRTANVCLVDKDIGNSALACLFQQIGLDSFALSYIK